MTSPDAVRTRLTQRYNELSERLARVNDDRQHRSQAQSDNWTERATERENDEVLNQLAESTFGEIAKLRHSLERLDQGHYGVCEDCGKSIGPERMQLVPYATHCMGCLAGGTRG
jgi:RNA polymerase-binding protein DksA